MALTLPNDIWWLIYKNIENEKKMEVKKNYKENVLDVIKFINEDIDNLWEVEEDGEVINFYDWYFDYRGIYSY